MFITDYQEKKYNDTFDKVYKSLKYQIENDESFKVGDLELLLKDLYANQGNDWLGRGNIIDIVNSARAAACERLLTECKGSL